MKKQTLKNFCEKSHIDATLIRAVVRQIGGWQEFKERAEDVANHGANGGFSGFIYYSDTVPFTKRNKATILDYAKQLAQDIGDGNMFTMMAQFRALNDLDAEEIAEAIYNYRSDNRTQVYNVLAWFALEEVARSYCDMIENND